MDTKSQFVLIAKRILRELRILYAVVATGIKRSPKHIDARRAENEGKEQYKDVQPPPWLEPILSEYKRSVREKQSSDERQYAVQNSIRKATWCAFWAVLIYAGITLLIWRANQKAAEAAKGAAMLLKANFDRGLMQKSLALAR